MQRALNIRGYAGPVRRQMGVECRMNGSMWVHAVICRARVKRAALSSGEEVGDHNEGFCITSPPISVRISCITNATLCSSIL